MEICQNWLLWGILLIIILKLLYYHFIIIIQDVLIDGIMSGWQSGLIFGLSERLVHVNKLGLLLGLTPNPNHIPPITQIFL